MSLILIVEHNETNLKLVRDLLQVKGYKTVEAGKNEDVVKVARSREPDLILLDICPPEMHGVKVLKALRAEPATAKIPVIATSASVMQQDLQEIVRAGFDDFIEKPINLSKLLDAVQRASVRAKA